jgi:predicted RND superfamily exporter protein
VIFGLLVMSSFVPAARTILDRRRARRGRSIPHASLDHALPGLGPFLGRVADLVVRRPLIVLALVGGVTVAAVVGASTLESTFDQTDLLPAGEILDDVEFLEAGLGGRSEVVTVLVEADLTSDRTLRDLIDLELALVDENRRPEAVSGPVILSLVTLVQDWAEPSHLAGDKYDPAFREFLEGLDTGLIVPPDVVESVFAELRRIDPEGLASVARFNEGRPDTTIVQFPARTGDEAASRRLVSQVDRLWFGEDDAITTVGGEILMVTVTDELAASQAEGMAITVGVILVVLLLVFGITHFRPILGLFAVIPIAAVLAWVLASMSLLGIPYNAITAVITVVTIGVGVDYTIHLTHRFLEERHKTHSIGAAMRETMHTTGGALIGSAVTTALGFAVLLAAPLTPMRHFGILTALTILYSLVAAFVVLPPTLTLWAVYHRWREHTFSDDPDRAEHAEPWHHSG